MNQVAEILIKGRDFLQENKWGRGFYHDGETGSYCAVGALWCGNFGPDYWESVTSHDADYYTMVQKAEAVLNTAAPNGNIVRFNDHVAKEKRQIIRLYNKAIKSLESK